MTLIRPEVASQYGALDSAAVADGEASHAHELRELGRNSNRLLQQGGPLHVWAFDSSTDGTEANKSGMLSGYTAFGGWQMLVPGPIVVPKKPNLRSAEIQVFAKLQGSLNLWIQIATNAAPYNEHADLENAANILKLNADGDNDIDLYTKTGIPLGPGGLEEIALFVMGEPTTTASTGGGSGGDHNTGTVDLCSTGYFRDASANWNTSGTTYADDNKHYLTFSEPTSGALMTGPRSISGVRSSTELEFWPEMSPSEAAWLTGASATYDIYHQATYRVVSISLYMEDQPVGV
tara:strand:+ start:3108 stop:3980 length:873 start_codon:yes stop_codon:yes gene_type:complete